MILQPLFWPLRSGDAENYVKFGLSSSYDMKKHTANLQRDSQVSSETTVEAKQGIGLVLFIVPTSTMTTKTLNWYDFLVEAMPYLSL